jgi:hypothetical protein
MFWLTVVTVPALLLVVGAIDSSRRCQCFLEHEIIWAVLETDCGVIVTIGTIDGP